MYNRQRLNLRFREADKPDRGFHISAKMIPFLTIGLIDLALGLIIGKFFSTFPATQQHFMFIAFFFMIIFILMSGIFTPVESMPVWAQKVNLLNPLSYLMRINRMVMLKGSTFHDIIREIISLVVIALTFTTFAVKSITF